MSQRTSHRLAPSTADHMIAESVSISDARQTSHRRKDLVIIAKSLTVTDASTSRRKERASDDGMHTAQSADIVPISTSLLDISDE